MPILPIFYENVLGINKAFIGLIEGFAESFLSIMKLVSGYISDKLKKRKFFIVLGYVIAGVMKPVFVVATSWWHIFIIRFLERSGKGVRDAPRDALLAASTHRKYRGSAFGYQRMMDTLGAVLGVIVLLLVLDYLGGNFHPLFLFAFIPAMISVLIAATKVKEDKKLKKSKLKIDLKEVRKMPRSYQLFLIPTIIFAIGNMSYAFFILRAQDLGVILAIIPLVYLIYNIVYASLAYPAGILSDKIGKIFTLIIGYVFFLLSCVLFIINLPTHLVWVVFACYGVFFAFTVGVAKAYISDIVPPEKTATAVGLYTSINGVCALPASAIVGILWHTYNPQIAFGYSAILAVIAIILYLILYPKLKLRR